MNKFMNKIFNVFLGSPSKFVTDVNKNKAIRVSVVVLITILYFAITFGLLYIATKFQSIFVWVILISCCVVLVDNVFTFIKRYMIASGYQVKMFDNEEN